MEKKQLIIEINTINEELLSIHNKIQEAINLARDGKWYHADTKMQGTKQKVLNLYRQGKEIKDNLNNEDNKN